MNWQAPYPSIYNLVGDRSTGFREIDDQHDYEYEDAEDDMTFEREQRDAVFDSENYETVGSGPNGEWTDKDEAGLEKHEIAKRERIALANEY